jgi:ATP synthase mitochondrial F1 complex assembly factor 1
MILLQFQSNQVYFTPLLEYQTNRENSRPCLSLTFHTELSKTKDLVLMVGDVSNDSLSIENAQHLVYQLQLFYVTGSDVQKEMVQKFWENPKEFKYEELIECLQLLPE